MVAQGNLNPYLLKISFPFHAFKSPLNGLRRAICLLPKLMGYLRLRLTFLSSNVNVLSCQVHVVLGYREDYESHSN